MYRDELLKSLLGQRELALLQINQAQPGQGTEVARLELQGSLDVFDRGVGIPDQVVKRGTFVPAFRKIREILHNLAENQQRFRELATIHCLGAQCQQLLNICVLMFKPNLPNPVFCCAQHIRVTYQ